MTPTEQERREIQILSDHYMNRFCSYLLFRMFVNAQEPLNDEEFNHVVEQLLSGYRREQDAGVREILKRKPGLEVDVEALRIRHREAIEPVQAGIKTYMLKLRAAAKADGPGWGGGDA